MKSALPAAALLLLLLLGPLLLRREHEHAAAVVQGPAEETLVIITPHNEATRHEFARAFAAAHFARTGRRVEVDWRTAGGTSELARYIAAQYRGSFRDYWTNTLHRAWSPEAGAAFDDPKSAPNAPARQAFLASNVGCGHDLFFGGGSFDFIQMAAAGRLADSGLLAAHPDWFGADHPHGIPQILGGERLWDPQGRWIGACLGAFGICYNADSLARLGLPPPRAWADLQDPRYRNELALADPTQSGSVAKAFEMILQQQMAAAGPAEGWRRGLALIQRLAANARYFTDGAADIPVTVQAGDAAAGMCIDFYGRFESEAVRRPDGSSRLQYVTPEGGSSTGADPIGMFRGAPHPALAREFIEFVLSEKGQKIWCFRAGQPGGPERYTLRRLPIRPGLYAAEWRAFEADPGIDPYDQAAGLSYHPAWTASLFRVISFTVRAAFIDPEPELREAWEALIAAHFPPRATARFSDLSAIDYGLAAGPIREALRSPDAANAMARELDEHFRAQYREAAGLARRGE